jgi:hypothetical protein
MICAARALASDHDLILVIVLAGKYSAWTCTVADPAAAYMLHVHACGALPHYSADSPTEAVERAAKELRDATFAQNLALFAQRVGKPLFSRSPSERPPSLFEYVPLGCLVGNEPPPVPVPADAFWYNHHHGKHSLGGGKAMDKPEFEAMVAPFLPLLRSDGAVEAQVAAGLPVSTAPDAGRPTASSSGSATSPTLLDFTPRPNYLREPQHKVHPTTSLSFGTSPPMLKRGRCSDAHLRCAATALRCRSCAGRRSRCRSRRTKCWRRSSLSASLRSCRRCARYGMLPQLGRPGPLWHLPLPSGCHRARRRWGAERLVCLRCCSAWARWSSA